MVTVQQHNHDDTIKKGYYCCSSFSSSQSSVISSTSVSSILHGFRHSYSVHPHISVHAMPLFLQLQFFFAAFFTVTLYKVYYCLRCWRIQRQYRSITIALLLPTIVFWRRHLLATHHVTTPNHRLIWNNKWTWNRTEMTWNWTELPGIEQNYLELNGNRLEITFKWP